MRWNRGQGGIRRGGFRGRWDFEIPEKYTSLLEHFRLIVVIDFEPREENLVFVTGQGACEFFLSGFGVKPALLDQCPKSRVIEVVDVAIDLPPTQIVP